MKPDIHPKYHESAKVRCGCGKTFTIGSTRPEMEIEICGKCHPFYTGKEKFIDTAGRVEKFKARREKAAKAATVKAAAVKLKVKKVTKAKKAKK